MMQRRFFLQDISLGSILILSMALLRCTDTSLSGGFGSETTNGVVTGTALLPDGRPSSGARVTVRRADFVNDSLPRQVVYKARTGGDVVTDSTGAFTVDSLDTGSYVVEINDNTANAVKTECDISREQAEVDLEQAILQPYATLVGWVDPSLINGDAYVQIVGLDRLVQVDSSGSYTLNDLPYGTVQVRVVTADSVVVPVVNQSVSSLPGQTTVVPPSGWKFSRRVFLNTTASGAGINGSPVTNFPLLVRLDTTTFDFAGATSGGRDCRFTKSNGASMAFEIERWDAQAGKAEVWVLVDTVYANDSTHYFLINWGNDTIAGASNGSAVFDSSAGYLGVWHLNGDGDDATARKNNAVACTPADTEGMIGLGKKFNGVDSIKMAGLLGSPASVTLSAWAQLDSVSPDGGGEILSIGDAVLIRMDYVLAGMGTIGSIHLTGDSTFYNVSSGQFLQQTGWHFITYTLDNGSHSHTLYIDGAKAVSQADSNTAIIYSGVGRDTYIGMHGNGKTNFNFFGGIDEVRVCRAAVSANYVKLCYMNQKGNDALVVFRQ